MSVFITAGTQSKLKLQAIEEAATEIYDESNIVTNGIIAKSYVNDQPYGYDEIILGANNRLSFCDASNKPSHTNNDEKINILISIENGIVNIGDSFYDLAFVIAKDTNSGKVSKAFSSTVEIPDEYIQQIRKSNFSQTIGDVLQKETEDENHNKDPHYYFTNGNVSRKTILSDCIKIVLSQIKEKKEELYSMHPDHGLICNVCGCSAQAQHMDCYYTMYDD